MNPQPPLNLPLQSQVSPKWHLNSEDFKQVLFMICSTLGSTVLYEAVIYLSKIQWNQSTTLGLLMFNITPLLVSVVKQWVSGPPCTFNSQATQAIESVVTPSQPVQPPPATI